MDKIEGDAGELSSKSVCRQKHGINGRKCRNKAGCAKEYAESRTDSGSGRGFEKLRCDRYE